jgi:hypothetical protein
MIGLSRVTWDQSDPHEELDTCINQKLGHVIGCVTAMKMRLRTLLHSCRSQADAVGSYAKSMKGVTCDTSAS